MEENMQEILEIYMDMVEKQDEIIHKMSEVLRQYTREIHHLRNLNQYFSEESALRKEETKLQECIKEYNEMKD